MIYQFKVGDKGKTRGGDDYEVICVDKRLHPEERVVSLVFGRIHTSCLDGRYWDDHDGCDKDLIPPSRKVKVRFVDFGDGVAAYSEFARAFRLEWEGATYDRTIEVELNE